MIGLLPSCPFIPSLPPFPFLPVSCPSPPHSPLLVSPNVLRSLPHPASAASPIRAYQKQVILY